MSGVVCPRCALINPERSLRCDCGWRFDASPVASAENHRLGGEKNRAQNDSRELAVLGGFLLVAGVVLTIAFIIERGRNGYFVIFTGLILVGIKLLVRGLGGSR